MKRSHRFLRTLALSFLVLLAAGALLEQLARVRAARRFPLGGRLVRVGDHRLHLRARGSGQPVVVLESGLDTGGSLPWATVQRQVARFTCAVAYDRAGTLGSERGSGPKTGATMALELHALLHQAGYPGPYILVGHSLGGVLLRFFVRQYPHEVRGVVFVDASHQDQLQRFPPEPAAAFPTPAPWLVGLAGTTGLLRLVNYVANDDDRYPGTQARDSLNLVNNAFLPVSLAATLEEQQQADSGPAARSPAAAVFRRYPPADCHRYQPRLVCRDGTAGRPNLAPVTARIPPPFDS